MFLASPQDDGWGAGLIWHQQKNLAVNHRPELVSILVIKIMLLLLVCEEYYTPSNKKIIASLSSFFFLHTHATCKEKEQDILCLLSIYSKLIKIFLSRNSSYAFLYGMFSFYVCHHLFIPSLLIGQWRYFRWEVIFSLAFVLNYNYIFKLLSL